MNPQICGKVSTHDTNNSVSRVLETLYKTFRLRRVFRGMIPRTE
jgi:hypothetical protein